MVLFKIFSAMRNNYRNVESCSLATEGIFVHRMFVQQMIKTEDLLTRSSVKSHPSDCHLKETCLALANHYILTRKYYTNNFSKRYVLDCFLCMSKDEIVYVTSY